MHKPHIYPHPFYAGMWICRTLHSPVYVGATPAKAWHEWRQDNQYLMLVPARALRRPA